MYQILIVMIMSVLYDLKLSFGLNVHILQEASSIPNVLRPLLSATCIASSIVVFVPR